MFSVKILRKLVVAVSLGFRRSFVQLSFLDSYLDKRIKLISENQSHHSNLPWCPGSLFSWMVIWSVESKSCPYRSFLMCFLYQNNLTMITRARDLKALGYSTGRWRNVLFGPLASVLELERFWLSRFIFTMGHFYNCNEKGILPEITIRFHWQLCFCDPANELFICSCDYCARRQLQTPALRHWKSPQVQSRAAGERGFQEKLPKKELSSSLVWGRIGSCFL